MADNGWQNRSITDRLEPHLGLRLTWLYGGKLLAWLSGRGEAMTSDSGYRTRSVHYFARKHDISVEQARELMRKVGRNRDKLNEAAARSFSEVGCIDYNL